MAQADLQFQNAKSPVDYLVAPHQLASYLEVWSGK